MFYVEFEMSTSISLLLLVRLSPSLMNVQASCPVFIAIVFFDLGYMLVNWGRLLILGQWAALLSTASISTWFCFTTVR